jgi:hypothetical protein
MYVVITAVQARAIVVAVGRAVRRATMFLYGVVQTMMLGPRRVGAMKAEVAMNAATTAGTRTLKAVMSVVTTVRAAMRAVVAAVVTAETNETTAMLRNHCPVTKC